ncbi:MAG: hypothetical protein IPK16_11405 [Anaerolineales bacterium]|nr:hypothetical protein [Anaerolineales bacterium]
MTLPFFYYLQMVKDPEAVIARLETAQLQSEHTKSVAWNATVSQLVQDLRISGAIEAAEAEARTYLRRAGDNLAVLPDVPARRSMLGLCEFVVQRTH